MPRIYANPSDIISTGRTLTDAQQYAAGVLLEDASAKLRLTAMKYGKDIDALIDDEVNGYDYAIVVKNVVVQAVCRALTCLSDSSPAVTSGTQSALGYSVSMTYLNAGQNLYFLKNELKELGFFRQSYGALEVYDYDDSTERH